MQGAALADVPADDGAGGQRPEGDRLAVDLGVIGNDVCPGVEQVVCRPPTCDRDGDEPRDATPALSGAGAES